MGKGEGERVIDGKAFPIIIDVYATADWLAVVNGSIRANHRRVERHTRVGPACVSHAYSIL